MSMKDKTLEELLAEVSADGYGWLIEALKPGTTVYTSVSNVSSSGMSRHIKLYVPLSPDRYGGVSIYDLTWLAAKLLGYRVSDKTGGLVVSGCGMNMGFHVVYELSRSLYRGGHACVGRYRKSPYRAGCPSNDHANGERRYGKSVRHRDGGYALRQAWL